MSSLKRRVSSEVSIQLRAQNKNYFLDKFYEWRETALTSNPEFNTKSCVLNLG